MLDSTFNLASADLWYERNEADLEKFSKWLIDSAGHIISSAKKGGIRIDPNIGLVCQVISNRYYPYTKSDNRSIVVGHDGVFFDFDWEEYKTKWNAEKTLQLLSLDAAYIKQMCEAISFDARHADPIENWFELVEFIDIDKKERLKGNALLAQSLYGMGKMLKLFYKDITGGEVNSYFIDSGWATRFYGEDVIVDKLQYLEYLCNLFHLNPRPKLILFVEGKGEFEQIPRIAKDLLGYDFSVVGIRVENLRGIDEFSGKKGEKGGKLLKIIEHYHYMQTIVFIILDNEKTSNVIKNAILKAKTRINDIEKKVTKEEFIVLWDTNIEFDNFSDYEIAQALTSLSSNRYAFTQTEIGEARRQFGKVGDPLSQLYRNSLSYDLNKPMLLKELVDTILSNPSAEFEKGYPRRKIVAKIYEIIKLASRNHLPINRDIWEKNQKSGHLGDIIGGDKI